MTCFNFLIGAPKWEDVILRGDVEGVRLTNDINIAALAEQALYSDIAIQSNAKWTSKKVTVQKGDLLLPVEATLNNEPYRVGELLGDDESAALKALRVGRLIIFLVLHLSNLPY